jgi:ACR3 family arsenite efflux pump ArsB
MSLILSWLQKHLVWSIPGAMLLGLAYGRWADGNALRWTIMPLTFLMVYPMMVTLNLRALANRGGGGLQLMALALNFVLMPLLGWGLGLLFFAEQPAARLALLLTARRCHRAGLRHGDAQPLDRAGHCHRRLSRAGR